MALFQLLLKIAGLLFLMPLFLIEAAVQAPLLGAWLQTHVPAIATQVALVYLALQVVSCGLMSLLFEPGYRLVQRLSPRSEEERLSSPKYLYSQALDEAQSALALVEREQTRLVKRLPQLLDTVREEGRDLGTSNQTSLDARSLHSAGSAVAAACRDFLGSSGFQVISKII